MPADFVAPPSIPEDENWVTSQCPEFYAEDALMLSLVIYLGLLWLGLIVLLNPGVTIGKFTKKYLKLRWWLIINSMWIWVVIPHHLETASYYPVISVTLLAHNICNVDGKFKVPPSLSKYFIIMSVKGGPAMVANGYIFSCNNANWGFKSWHYTCEDCSCPVRLNTEHWDLVQTIKGEHTCVMPNTTITRLLK
ncbi:hypothetical protein DSO57_1024572 [Entomophthora muscae]|uniref:Uncharacterized protein n=1 Tax=Entomophthora muscae TaxID=34485 RepID=A0ACC2RTH8_9FUNG|nr:hypothetical protein DSO57_1024572 [Entomophthora muscae]